MRGRAVHDCPGCGSPGVPNFKLACVRCWYRLPASIRTAVSEGWVLRGVDGGEAHRAALHDAFEWYRHEAGEGQ